MNSTLFAHNHSKIVYWLSITAIVVGLYFTTRVNYLLFHSLVELFSIIVAVSVFIITWNSVKYIKNPYLIMVGISYLFIAILDLLHTLAYKGMPIFIDYDFYANQLWIAARFMESCTLLVAFHLLFAKIKVKAELVFEIYFLVTSLLIASIFYWKIFPVCFVAGKGLTPFKIYSEYVICAILISSIILLVRNRRLFADPVYKFLLLSMVFTIISELAFTFYISNYGISNIVGHYFKLFAFMMIYRAIVATGINEPYSLIFNELVQMNRALLESEQFSKAVLDTVGSLVVVLDMDGHILRFNQACEAATGYLADDVLGRVFWEFLVPEEDLEGVRQMWGTMKAGNFPNSHENQWIAKDGSRHLILWTNTAIEQNGRMVYAIGAGLDITERKKAEIAAARFMLRQRAILDNLPMMAWLKDTDSRLEMVNEPYARACGHPLEECLGKTDLELFPEEMARGYMADDHTVCISGRKKMVEERIATPDGIKWHFTCKTPIFDEQGKVIGTTGIAQDITERRLAEQALIASEERFRDIANASADWIWEVDSNGVYVFASQSVKETLGYEPEEVLGITPFDLMPVSEAQRARHEFHLVAQRRDSFRDFENINLHKDGTVRLIQTSGVPIIDGQGELLGYRGVDKDITERKQAEESLLKSAAELQAANVALRESRAAAIDLMQDAVEARQAAEQARKDLQKANNELEFHVAERTSELAIALLDLQDETAERLLAMETLREKEQMLIQQSRLAAMGEMIGNIAHQWRQPLNTLGLLTQRLGYFFDTPSFNKEFLDSSVAKSMEIIQHMSKTIDDFRDYFKPDKEKADFDISVAIKNTLSLLEGSFQNPMISVDIVEKDNPVVYGYQNEFAQVLLNILINARDVLIEREIVDARVMITSCCENGCAVVTVSDNAGGIPEEIINKVFDPYFTTKGPQQGTGVGLFMSKTIIERNMGGKLTVRNTEIGAEFRIEV